MAVQMFEWSVFQGDVDLMGRHAHVLGGKTLPDVMIIDMQRGMHRRAFQLGNTRPAAPWQKLGILLHAVHQIEHLLRTVRNQYRFFYQCHCFSKLRNQRLVE